MRLDVEGFVELNVDLLVLGRSSREILEFVHVLGVIALFLLVIEDRHEGGVGGVQVLGGFQTSGFVFDRTGELNHQLNVGLFIWTVLEEKSDLVLFARQIGKIQSGLASTLLLIFHDDVGFDSDGLCESRRVVKVLELEFLVKRTSGVLRRWIEGHWVSFGLIHIARDSNRDLAFEGNVQFQGLEVQV